ncbi:helix-turn-helix domain-containing protein [Hydrogenophaga crassostreae]|nr:helix-turn-helix domain-containing protein [Hydrogenophaga crassostreae]
MDGHEAACAEVGVGPRQLERLCRQHLGMTPHRAQTILRMQATLRSAMKAAETRQGAELALSQGFFDQSHMARDLKRLAGLPLGRAVAASRDAESTEWPLAVGQQQFSQPGLPGEPGTTAVRMPAPTQNTSKHTARADAAAAPAKSRR